MNSDTSLGPPPDWKTALPTLTARVVTLREIASSDVGPVIELLSCGDAGRFGIEAANVDVAAQRLLDRALRQRTSGTGFTYAITIAASRAVAGLIHVRQLDPLFEAAECDGVILPGFRGGDVFIESARLVGSFLFGTLGAHRLEVRVPVQNGRSNGAMKKLGAVQEGVLRGARRQGDRYVDQVLWSILKEEWGDHWVSVAPRVH
jgi:RimJ/RimL family protein N-acetyltransferase